MSDYQDIHQLFKKYLTNSCTPEEATHFMQMLQSGKEQRYIEQLIDAYLQQGSTSPDAVADDATLTRIFKKLNLGDNQPSKHRKSLFFYLKAAAAMLLVAGVTGAYYYFQNKEKELTVVKNDASPGGNRATLTLADGQTIDLNTQQNGIVMGDGIKYRDGSSVLDKQANVRTSPQVYTLTTPKGGTYQITLPDGTDVWLNSASTLKYPSRFEGRERVVELDGEAYFEVSEQVSRKANGQKIPFKVISYVQTVEVLGTHFNINAYADESTTNTTLVEGAVRVLTAQTTTLLKPGQQSKADTQGIRVADVDVETAVDWKNGDFIFADENLKSIMRKIARWYGVKVIYQDELSDDTYNAQISRNKNLSEVLYILELSGGLTFIIENDILYLSSPK